MSFLLYWGGVVLAGLQKVFHDSALSDKRSNELEIQLSNATLSTLKAQLKPHFLFNTLNMVDFLIHKDPKKAVNTLDKLEELIKSTFDQNQPNSCTLQLEMNFIEKYLEIEKERFQERLVVNLEIDEETKAYKIPCYLIQPLVENSIKHGVGKTMGVCTITIRTLLKGNFFIIQVSDNANAIKHKADEQVEKSVGLKNIESRIKIFFGPEAFLDVGYSGDGNFKSDIVIPKKYIEQ